MIYHLRNLRSLNPRHSKMSALLKRYKESSEKWRNLSQKILGNTVGYYYRLDPDKGQIYFLSNGKQLIRADITLVAFTATKKNKVNWQWAWASKRLPRLSSEFRFSQNDIAEYKGDMTEVQEYFQKSSFQLDLQNPQNRQMEVLLRAFVLDMLEGQFVYEAEMGLGGNTLNVIYVVSNAKKIKGAEQNLPPEQKESVETAVQLIEKGEPVTDAQKKELHNKGVNIEEQPPDEYSE